MNHFFVHFWNTHPFAGIFLYWPHHIKFALNGFFKKQVNVWSKAICFCFFFLPFSVTSFGSPCIFHCKINSLITNQPISGVHVLLSNGNQTYTAMSSSDGTFSVKIENEGAFKIKALHISYIEHNDEIEIICSDDTVYSILLLEPKAYSLDEVEIRTKQSDEEKMLVINELSSVSSHLISPKSLEALPATMGDPARLALSMPGVSVGEEDSGNEVVVRGNTPRGNAWRVENIDITSSLSHFSAEGRSGGSISMLSPNLIGPSAFFTSAYPANYGNAFGGVFDIRLKNVSKDKYKFKLTASVAEAQPPFSQKSKAV